MANIYDVAQSFRKALLRRERAAAIRLVEAYGAAYESLSAQLDKLTNQIEQARAVGEIVSKAWLVKQKRYQLLLAQVVLEIAKFADIAREVIAKQQRQAIDQAIEDSEKLVTAGAKESAESISGEFNRINKSAVENLVGFLGDGSPLKSLLDELPRKAGMMVRRKLADGLIRGRNLRAVAREIRAGLNGNLVRAMRIARTETLRAYRGTSQQTYEENSDVIEGWIWLSALQPRSCAACIALHGTFHSVDEPMKSHVNCRCTQVPVVKGVDLGIEKGTDWFKKQPAKVQKKIFDDQESKYKAYKTGELTLEDFVRLRRDPKWGDSYEVLGLKRALAEEGRFPGDARRPIPAVIPPRARRAPKPPAIPRLSDEARARIAAADLDGERLSVEKLGIEHKSFNFPAGKIKTSTISVNVDQVVLSRDVLTKDRLLRLEKDLAGGLKKQRVFNITVVRDLQNPDKYIVSEDGNHRIAYLKLVRYQGKVDVILQESRSIPAKPKPKAPPKKKLKDFLDGLDSPFNILGSQTKL